MFEKILVPVDGSLAVEGCLPHLITIARAFEAQVVLLHIPFPSTGASGQAVNAWDWQVWQAEAEVYLTELSARLEKAGLNVQTELLAGKYPDNLLNRASPENTDLILLGDPGRGGPNDRALRGPILNLIQRSAASVMIVRSTPPLLEALAPIRYQNILAPLDGSQRAEYGLPVAAHLARTQQASLLLAHVIKPPDMPRRTPLTTPDSLLVKQVVESNQADASLYLDRLKSSLGARVKTFITVSQRVADTLHRLVEQEKIDLVVLNAHGLSGDLQWPYGSITANFLANTGVPLLVVQDFTQARRIQAGMAAGEPAGYTRPFLNASRQAYREVGSRDRAE